MAKAMVSYIMSQNNLYIVPIEPIETRYTKHWYEFLPSQIALNCYNKFAVKQIEVEFSSVENTSGAFLNFAKTVEYKALQTQKIAEMFSQGKVKENDVFLITDYWNPCAHMIRYMSTLLSIPVKLVGICHAGVWDPADILASKMSVMKEWASSLELSMDRLYDHKIFATEFSKTLYENTYGKSDNNHVTGFPMEYYERIFPDLIDFTIKEDIVCFPHRISPEKNYDLFKEIEHILPQYKFVVAMEVCKTKEEYHALLKKSKLCFSASLQETLGISIGIESLIAGCDVVVPDYLSYKEMFLDEFKYDPLVLTMSNRAEFLAGLIDSRMREYINRIEYIKYQRDFNKRNFFSGERFYKLLNELN